MTAGGIRKLNIILYKFTGTPDRVDKTNYLTEQKRLSGVKLLNSESILSPLFRVKYDADIYKSNYCKCVETGRYYFINDIVMDNGRALILQTSADTLYTAKESIYNSPAWVSVSEYDTDAGQKMLNNNFPFQQDDVIESWVFPNEVFSKDASTIIMVTI